MFGRKKGAQPGARESVQMIPVLCKLWKEDEVWNACAEHLPVAVFGDSFEEATKHLGDAIISHLQSLEEAGQIQQVIVFLQKRAQDHMLVTEIAPGEPILKMLVPLDQPLDQQLATECA